MKTREISAGELEPGFEYREYGDLDDGYKKVVWVGWHGDTVLITYAEPTEADPDQMRTVDTTLDMDTMVERKVEE